MVINVEKDSPAENAKLLEGDRIITFGGQPVTGIDDLHKLLTETQVGVKTDLKVLRGTDILNLEIIPEERRN